MMKQHIPNILTISRIAFIPVLIALLYYPQNWAIWAALGLYTLIAITDFLDGYFARKWNIVSPFGTFLDPIADKILVAALLITLVDIDHLEGIWTIPAIIILVREFLVSGMREFLGPKNIKLPVSQLGKLKTTVQMFALGFLIIGNDPYLCIGEIGLLLAAILTVLSGWGYLKMGLSHINS